MFWLKTPKKKNRILVSNNCISKLRKLYNEGLGSHLHKFGGEK